MNDERLDWECRPDWLCVMNGRVTDCGIEKMANYHDEHRERQHEKEVRHDEV